MVEQWKGDNPLVKHYNGKIRIIITVIHHSGTVNVKLYVIYSIAYMLVYLHTIICVYAYFMVRE